MEVYTGDVYTHQPRPVLKETRKRQSYTANSTEGSGNLSNKRRIVPEQSRKRTSISCDLCKTRRVKCVRTEPSSSPTEGPSPCQNCIKLQVACQSALPRKKRIYGSVESLGTRFNVLELLIKDLLPDEDTSNTDRLLEIAKSRNLPMPGNTDHTGPQLLPFLDSGDATGYDAENSRSNGLQPPVISPPVFSNPAGTTAPSQGPYSRSQRSSNADPIHSPLATHIRPDEKEGEDNPFSEKPQVNTHRSSLAMREKLYPNTQGMVSYLGPSSSFKFMIRVREMLIGRSVGDLETGSTKSQTTNGSTLHDETLRLEFATNRASKVIERHFPNGGDDADGAGSDLNPLRPVRTAQTFGTALSGCRHSTIEPAASESRSSHDQTAGSSAASRRDRPHSDAENQDDTTTSLVNRARKDLPSRQTLDALVEAFFKQVHPNYVVFHRGVFQNHYETLFPAPGIEEDDKSHHTDEMPSTLDVGWISSICMVLTFGAQALEYRDRRRALILQKRYFRVVETALCQLLNTTTLSSIQALLLLQLYQHNAGERNASWVVLGCACRMAMALGMHRDSITGGFDPVERELRRRIWWTLFGFEQDLCLTLGRPSAIADLEEVSVGLPNEALMDGISSVPPSHLKHSLQLTKMSHEIRKNLIAVACIAGTPKSRGQANHVDRISQQERNMQATKSLLERLDDWCHNLPQELGLQRYVAGTNYYRAVHLLHLNYNHYKQVLTRSYLLQEIESRLENANGPRDASRVAETADEKAMSNTCLESALQTVVILENLRQANQLDGVTWQDYYYAYHSGILLLVSILPGQLQGHHQSRNAINGVPQRTKEAVDNLVVIMQQPRLCKTMRFFASVTLQLAKIVGLVWHEDTISSSTNTESSSRAVPDSGLSAANLNNFTASTSVADDWLENFLSQSDPFAYEPGGFIPSAQHVQFGAPGLSDGITSNSGEGDMVLRDVAGHPFSPFPSSLLSPPFYSALGVESTGFDTLHADDRPTDAPAPRIMWDRIVLN